MASSMGDPVILSFAMSVEEWARVSAALQAAAIMARERVTEVGQPMPEEVEQLVGTVDMFTRMVHDEMYRALDS